MRIISGSKKQTEPTRKYRFSSGPEKITYRGFFIGPAGLCLRLGPILDPIINMLCLFGIFGYFEYVSGIMNIFFRFLVYDYSFWFQVNFQINFFLGIWVKFWVFSIQCQILNFLSICLEFQVFFVFLIFFRFFRYFESFQDPKYPNRCRFITSISGPTTF